MARSSLGSRESFCRVTIKDSLGTTQGKKAQDNVISIQNSGHVNLVGTIHSLEKEWGRVAYNQLQFMIIFFFPGSQRRWFCMFVLHLIVTKYIPKH